jgi:hypothetical protein
MKKLELKQMGSFIAADNNEGYCTLFSSNPFSRLFCIRQPTAQDEINEALCDLLGHTLFLTVGLPFADPFKGLCG